MWSDTLLVAEKNHLVRLLFWGAASMLAGTIILVLLTVRRVRAPVLTHFALQMTAWGAIDLMLVALAWRALQPRDFDAARRLDRFVWLNAGLDVGYVAVGATLIIASWVIGRRHGPIGAGLGIIVQGLALLLLDLQFATVLTRLT
jgi:hypothetical protein